VRFLDDSLTLEYLDGTNEDTFNVGHGVRLAICRQEIATKASKSGGIWDLVAIYVSTHALAINAVML